MEEERVRYLLISLTSYVVLLWLMIFLPYAHASDNTIAIQTKGTSTSISIDQSGSSNTTTVWCGLSNGTYTTHTCSNATMVMV